MLKNFFISMLGAIAGFWISMMLCFVALIAMAVGTVASSLMGQQIEPEKVKDGTVMRIVLDSPIEERATTRGFQQILNEQGDVQTLENILLAIRAAADDDRIKGIYLRCDGASAGFATRQAIARALADFKKKGKWIVAYADNYYQGDYWLASGADHLYLNPVGTIDLRGLAANIPFFKGLLDKMGVEMQVFKVGTYKSAVEPFILTEMSEANREMTRSFLDNLWGDIVNDISANRGLKPEVINQYADSMVTFDEPKSLVDMKLVDQLKYPDELKEELASLAGVKDKKDLSMVDYSDYLAQAELPHEKRNSNKIAVYYAFGDITDNGSEGITAEKMVPDILELAEDDDIKAMVLRVNSGGGSAFASEQIWHALEVFKQKGKTLYVSMGDYAASGGYYISCGAEKIYAEPTTLTGSIGIFGMLPCAKELLNDKLGVTIGTVTTNANGAFPSVYAPATPYQAEKMQSAIRRGYELFTSRCAEGRHLPQDSIKAIGEGRVWDGRTAKRIGLVDELGGLEDAVNALAAKMKYKKYQIVSYPEVERGFWDMIAEMPMQFKAKALKEELGSYYPIYMELKRLENLEPVQARMLPLTFE